MKLTRDGITYIHGATHAGLDCWLSEALAGFMENTGNPTLQAACQPPGDFARDELIRYLADPDGYKGVDGVLITGEKRESWPYRSPVYMLRPSTPVKFVSQDEGVKFTKTDNGVKIEFNPTPAQQRLMEHVKARFAARKLVVYDPNAPVEFTDQDPSEPCGDGVEILKEAITVKASDVTKPMRGEFTSYEAAKAAAPKNASRIIKWEDGSYSVEVEKAGDGKGSGQTPMDTAAPDQPDRKEIRILKSTASKTWEGVMYGGECFCRHDGDWMRYKHADSHWPLPNHYEPEVAQGNQILSSFIEWWERQ